MSSAPRLSILVPTYNYAEYLDEALRSLHERAQELPPGQTEIVIVDDGSTDNTPEILSRWGAEEAVVPVRQDNRGVAAARNAAMSRARGDFWMFFDSDDLLMPGCVLRTVEFLERNPDIGFFFTNYDIFDSSGVVHASGVDTWEMFRSIPHRLQEEDGWIFEASLTPLILEYGSFMHTSGLTVRREVAEAAGTFREGFSYGEDDDYWARCSALCTSGYVDQVLSRKRNHERSIIHDSARGLQNTRDLLSLSELQAKEWPQYGSILRAKSLRSAKSLIWGLLENGRGSEARDLLRTYLSRHPGHWPLHKLALKATIQRLG